ncbi:hypothetical protein [Halegenticoccus tardaugens]|uniref:hypothetical protein n=1 Tax=Halegenticoccus tardaugens TaxID=2071624 RepID=UPI00100A3C52|nr:hypothetical protein [Halegenticoccus tardaugens]
MSKAITHFAVGATVMTVLLAPVGRRVPFERTLILLGGCWGLIPDAYKPAPALAARTEAVHDSAAADVFWFHRALDLLDPNDSIAVASLAIGVWLAATVVVEVGRYLVARRPDGGVAKTRVE